MLDSDTYIEMQVKTLKAMGEDASDIRSLIKYLKSAFEFQGPLITDGPASHVSLQAYEDSATFLAALDVLQDAIDSDKPLD